MNTKPVGSRRNSHGYIKVKVAEPNVWMYEHHYIWEKENGKIQKGYIIHHIDGDKHNNTIGNLLCLTEAEHKALHGKEAIKNCHNDIVYAKHSEFMKKKWENLPRSKGYQKKHPDGYHVSDETKEKIRAKLKNKPWTDARRNAQKRKQPLT